MRRLNANQRNSNKPLDIWNSVCLVITTHLIECYNMELRHLRYFVAVAEELHFGRAAQRLMLSQPPLSQQIKALEKEVGTTLLMRTCRRVELTEAGRAYLLEARDILSRVEIAARSAQRAGNGHKGKLFVGYMAYAAINVVPKALQAFGQHSPQVEIVLEQMASVEQAQALRDRRIDVALLCPPFAADGLEVETIAKESLIAALSPGHSLARRQTVPLLSLANETFIFTKRRRDSGYLAQLDSICRAEGFELPHVREAHVDFAILPMIASGQGVCLAPTSARRVRYAGVAFRNLENCAAQVELAVAWRKRETSHLVRNFVELIRGQCRKQ
jgi:DNA-binding transcriptional LysR family regulator